MKENRYPDKNKFYFFNCRKKKEAAELHTKKREKKAPKKVSCRNIKISCKKKGCRNIKK